MDQARMRKLQARMKNKAAKIPEIDGAPPTAKADNSQQSDVDKGHESTDPPSPQEEEPPPPWSGGEPPPGIDDDIPF